MLEKTMSVKWLTLLSHARHVKLQQKNSLKIQHSKKHVRILKIMETLVGMTSSIVTMSLSDYGPDSKRKKKMFKVPVKITNKFDVIYCLKT